MASNYDTYGSSSAKIIPQSSTSSCVSWKHVSLQQQMVSNRSRTPPVERWVNLRLCDCSLGGSVRPSSSLLPRTINVSAPLLHTQAAGRDISKAADVASLTAITYMSLIIISYAVCCHLLTSIDMFVYFMRTNWVRLAHCIHLSAL